MGIKTRVTLRLLFIHYHTSKKVYANSVLYHRNGKFRAATRVILSTNYCKRMELRKFYDIVNTNGFLPFYILYGDLSPSPPPFTDDNRTCDGNSK